MANRVNLKDGTNGFDFLFQAAVAAGEYLSTANDNASIASWQLQLNSGWGVTYRTNIAEDEVRTLEDPANFPIVYLSCDFQEVIGDAGVIAARFSLQAWIWAGGWDEPDDAYKMCCNVKLALASILKQELRPDAEAKAVGGELDWPVWYNNCYPRGVVNRVVGQNVQLMRGEDGELTGLARGGLTHTWFHQEAL